MSGGFNFFRQSFSSKSNKKGHDIIYDSSVYDIDNKVVKNGDKVKIGEIVEGFARFFGDRIASLIQKEVVQLKGEEYIPGKTGVIQTLSKLARRGTENTGVSEGILSTVRKYAFAAGAILGGTAGASAAYGQDFIVGGQTGSLERSIGDTDSLRINKDLSFKSTKGQSSNGSLIGNTGKNSKGGYSQNQDFLVPSTGYDVLSRDNRSKSGGGSFKLGDKTTVSGNTSGDSKTNSTSGAISYNDKDTYAELSTTFGSNIAPKLSGVLSQVIKLNNGNKAGSAMKVSISAKSYRLLTGSTQVDIGKDGRLTIGVAHLQSMVNILNDKILMKTNSQIIDYEQVMAFSEFIHSMRVGVFHSKTGDKLNAQIQNLVEKNESIYRSYERITNLRGADSYTLYTGGSGDLGSQYTPVNLNVGIKWDRFNGTISDKIGPSVSLDMAYIWGPNNEHKIYGELNADLLRIQTDGGYLYKQYGISTGPRISNIAEDSRKPEQRFMIDFKVHPFDKRGHITSNRVASDLDLASSIRGILNSLLMLKPISKEPASYLEFLLNQRDLISSADFLPITFINYSNAVDLARTTLNKSKNLSKDQINVIISQVENSRSQLTFNSSDLRGTLSSFISSGTSLSGENFTKETWSKYKQALVEGEIIFSKGSRKEMTAYDVAHSQAQKMLDNTSHRVEIEVVEKNIYVVDLKKLPEGSFMDGRDLKIPLLVNNVKSLEGVFPGDQSHFSIEGNYLRISNIGHLQGGAQYFMMFLLDSGNYWLPTLGTTHGSVEIGVKTAPEATFKKGPTEVPPDLVMAYVTGKITEAGINTVVSQINSSKSKLKLYSDNYEKIKDTSSSYVMESWIIYVQSIITAREILNKNGAKKAEIDSAVAAVEKALEGLVPEQSIPVNPTITGVTNGGTYGSDVSVTVSDSAGTKSTLILDGASYTSGTPITAEGKHTLEIKTTKLSNGKTITQTLTFTIEKTLPTSPTITGIVNGGTYGNDVSLIVTDLAGSTSTITLDGNAYTSGTAITTEGKHTLVIKTTKASNGKEISQTLTFTIDKTSPTSPTITGVSNGGTYGNDVSAVITDADGSTSIITLDGNAYTSGTAITSDGKHILIITTTKTSNGKIITQTLSFTIDKAAPSNPTVSGVSNGIIYGNDITPSWSDASGTTSTATLNGSPYSSGTPITTDGSYTLVITTTKTSNGKTNTQTITFTVDKAAPSNPTVSGITNGTTYGVNVTPSWSDAGGTTSIATLNGSPYTNGTPITTDGSYTLVITTTKTSNGKTNTQTITFTVDKAAPSNPTVSGISNGTTYGVNVTPSWSDAGGTTSTATLNGSPYTNGTPITTDGSYTLVITTTKTSNGKTNTQTITFTVDKAAPSNPTVSGISNGNRYVDTATPSWSNAGGTTSTATLDGNAYTSGTAVTTGGSHTLVITTTKTSNGKTNTQTITFTVDKTPSVPTGTELQSQAITNSRGIELGMPPTAGITHWLVMDVASGGTCTPPSASDGRWTTDLFRYTLTSSGDGPKKVCIFVKSGDAVQPTPDIVNVELDTVVPDISGPSSLGTVTEGGNITGTVSFTENVKINSVTGTGSGDFGISTRTTYSNTLAINHPTGGAGSKTANIVIEDKAGNTKTVTITAEVNPDDGI